jgi:DNA (cytosine-5)-methyltransferase 1
VTRVLDLFCGAGLAADGWARAGYEVVGVDHAEQPDYPYEFHRDDAFNWLHSWRADHFDVIHAAPPCQDHSVLRGMRDAQGHGSRNSANDLLHVLSVLRVRWNHVPWVVENVPGAPMPKGSVRMCGSMFGLEVRRHRLFASNREIAPMKCAHTGRAWGVYGRPGDNLPGGGRTAMNVEHGRELMGVDREVPWHSLTQGVPPAYTQYVGTEIRRNSEHHGQ